MKTAVIQLGATDNKEKNIAKALKLVRTAIKARARFILLPEVFSFRGLTEKQSVRSKVAETIPGESTRPLMALAKRHRVYILAGSVYEKAKSSPKIYNTAVLINGRGRIAAKYRKINLFDALIGGKKLKESKTFLAGKRPVTAKIRDFKAGLSVCYDLRFPMLYQSYMKNGVNLLVVPSAFTYKTGKAHWKSLLRARAIENLSYVLAPNQIGTDKRGVRYYGHSMIIDPWGEVLAEGSFRKEEILFANINKNVILKARTMLPGI